MLLEPQQRRVNRPLISSIRLALICSIRRARPKPCRGPSTASVFRTISPAFREGFPASPVGIFYRKYARVPVACQQERFLVDNKNMKLRSMSLLFCSVLLLAVETVAGLNGPLPPAGKRKAAPAHARSHLYRGRRRVRRLLLRPRTGRRRSSQPGAMEEPVPGRPEGKTGKRTIHGLTVTTIDVSGTYSGMTGPGSGGGAPKPGYRMLGAIVENSRRQRVFSKFTGPAKTIAANQSKSTRCSIPSPNKIGILGS